MIKRLDESQLRLIHAIIGDLISLYNHQAKKEVDWWANQLSAFENDDLEKTSFVLAVEYLNTAYPEKRYNLAEAYLWSSSVKKKLWEPLEFLEGEFLILHPIDEDIRQPHLDDPFNAIRLPTFGFGGETLLGHTRRAKLSDAEFHDADKKFFNKFFMGKENPASGNRQVQPFPQMKRGADRRAFFRAVKNGVRAALNSDLSNDDTIAKECGRISLEILQNSMDEESRVPTRFLREDVFADDVALIHFGRTLIENSLYLINCLHISKFRLEVDDASYKSRTEFLNFLPGDERVTRLEEQTNCVFLEDGDIGLFLFTSLWLYEHKKREHESLSEASLLRSGLVNSTKPFISERARLAARFLEKACGLPGIDEELSNEYEHLVRVDNSPSEKERKDGTWAFLLRHWRDQDKDRERQMKMHDCIKGLMQSGEESKVNTLDDAVNAWRQFANQWLECNHYLPDPEKFLDSSPINTNIHEFLRRYESAPRSFLTFALSDLKGDTWQGVFVGTFHIGEGLEGETHESIKECRRELRSRIDLLKVVMTVVGKPIVARAAAIHLAEMKAKQAAEAVETREHRIRAGMATGLYHQLGQRLEVLKLAVEESCPASSGEVSPEWRTVGEATAKALAYRQFAFDALTGSRGPDQEIGSLAFSVFEALRFAAQFVLRQEVDTESNSDAPEPLHAAFGNSNVYLTVNWDPLRNIRVDLTLYGFILQELLVNALRYTGTSEGGMKALNVSLKETDNVRVLLVRNTISEAQYAALNNAKPPSEPPIGSQSGWGIHGVWAYFRHVHDIEYRGTRTEQVGNDFWAVTEVPIVCRVWR